MKQVLPGKAQLYWNTIKYLTVKQLAWRMYLQARKLLDGKLRVLGRLAWKKAGEAAIGETERRPWGRIEGTPWEKVLIPGEKSALIRQAQALAQHCFIFLNKEVHFGEQIKLHDEELSLLWRYNLQYFDYALTLGRAYQLTGDHNLYEAFKNIYLLWLAENPWGKGIGWHPYNVSLRTVNLMYAFDLFEGFLRKDRVFQEKLSQSIFVQLLFLEKHLEFDVGGNHLLENVKALTAGGLFFAGPNAERWLQKGIRLWQEELRKQVLADGGHYERSPSYHVRVLKNVGEVYYWVRPEENEFAEALKEYLEKMYAFLRGMMHPDGNIALFNDAVLLPEDEKRSLLEAGEELFPHFDMGFCAEGEKEEDLEARSFASSGYFGLQEKWEKGIYLLIDCGPLCPDELPAHAHADMLSFELSRGSKRIIVDSGVYTYGEGLWRDYARSTRAHNTVEIGGKDQCELWGSFRVGKRVKPELLQWKKEGNNFFFQGKHEGYRAEFGVAHIRNMIYLEDQVLLVLDQLKGNLKKSGVPVRSYLHLHPELELKEVGPDYYIFSEDGAGFDFVPLAFDKVSYVKGVTETQHENCIQGWFMPEFGKKIANYVLILEKELQEESVLGYLLNFSGEEVTATFSRKAGVWSVNVVGGKKEFEFQLV